MQSKETGLSLNEVKKGKEQELRIDLTEVSSKEAREIYIRHIIASIKEAKEEELKNGRNCQIELTIDITPEETIMFQKAKDSQGNRLFEARGVIKYTRLRTEQHRFTSK